MALDPVPLAIGGSGERDENGRPLGAENSVEGIRRSQYAATSGARGVDGIDHMKVVALPVPGGAVRVLSGSCTSPNDFLDNGGSQSYSGWEMSSTDVPATATGSGGGRINWLLWRVDDPQYAGQPPADIVKGPYNRYVWVGSNPFTNPPAYPHVPLVRLNQPANTATITNDMLTDVRSLANPKTGIFPYARPRIMADGSAGVNLTVRHANGGEYFPGGDGSPNVFSADIPEWATRMLIDARWMGVSYQGGRNVFGNRWIEFGDEYRDRGWPNNRQWEFSTEIFAFNAAEGRTSQRIDWNVMNEVVIPKKLRGKRTTFAFKASLSAASDLGVSMDYLGGLGAIIYWKQLATDSDRINA